MKQLLLPILFLTLAATAQEEKKLRAPIEKVTVFLSGALDKLTLAALEATLRIYRDGEPLLEIPTLRMLAAGTEELRARAGRLAAALANRGAEVVASESFAGSGANPARPLPSFAVALRGGDALAERLRALRPIAVFARQADGRVLLDARSLLCEDLDAVAAAVQRAFA